MWWRSGERIERVDSDLPLAIRWKRAGWREKMLSVENCSAPKNRGRCDGGGVKTHFIGIDSHPASLCELRRASRRAATVVSVAGIQSPVWRGGRVVCGLRRERCL